MKRILGSAAALLLALQAGTALAADFAGDDTLAAAPATTRVRPHPRPVVGPGNFSIGLEGGSEQGIAAKLRTGRMTAVDAGLSFDGVVRFHSDFLYEGGPVLTRRKLGIGWFAGAGARVEQDQSYQGNLYGLGLAASNSAKPGGGPPTPPPSSTGGSTSQWGVAARVPAGLEMRLTHVPRLEMFGEAAVEVGLIGRPGAALGGELGARWFF